jgi:hypothetical protein
MFFCPRHGHVQFPVNDAAVEILKDIVGEEIQLVVFLDGKAVDDVFTLRTLFVYRFADGGNLVSIRDDDTDRPIDVEARLPYLLMRCVFGRRSLFPFVYFDDHCSYHVSLNLVHLVGWRLFGGVGCNECDSAGA